jgi:glycosyltransferase involved in cell wall biosynthesis
MRIAYVTVYDSRLEGAWSGTGHFIPLSLEHAGADVVRIGPLSTPFEILSGWRAKLMNRTLPSTHSHVLEWSVAGSIAKRVAAELRGLEADVILAPDVVPVARLHTRVPIAIWGDATFANMINFYPDFQRLDSASTRNGHRITAAALERCSLAIYSSAWAAASAVADYGVDPSKVIEMPFGANIKHALTSEAVIKNSLAKSNGVCRLLFVGVDWWRKGGDIALEITRQLNAAGVPSMLTVVGSHGCGASNKSGSVAWLGGIDKTTPEGAGRISQLYSASHFLLLPARADCTPIVLNEAAAHGLPCLTTRVGGIGSIVRHGQNGFLFDKADPPERYVARILKTLSDFDAYLKLSMTSWEEYSARLNWEVTGRRVLHALEESIH